jgi:hypothetical protein
MKASIMVGISREFKKFLFGRNGHFEPSFVAVLVMSIGFLYLIRSISSSSLIYEQINISILISSSFYAFWVLRHRKIPLFFLMKKFVVLSLAVSLVLNLSILNIDRSRSFYVLSWIKNKSISIDENRLLINIQSLEGRNRQAVIQRITEARSRGLLHSTTEEIKLTTLGEVFFFGSNQIAEFYNLSGWFENEK